MDWEEEGKHAVGHVIIEVLDELGATERHPVHRGKFNPIIEKRWKNLGHAINPVSDFGQEVSAELHRYCSDAATWKKNAAKGRPGPDLFMMHGDGYWSVRDGVARDPLLRLL
jgi:hypothetical protein